MADCRFSPWSVVLLLVVGGVCWRESQAADPQVPEGFTIQKVAGFPLLQRPIFAAFDDRGILYVGESSGENLNREQMLAKKPHWISRLEDTNGDGVFDRSTKFVENITLPQGCLWLRGSLYAACPPSIWKFTDTDNDGVADQREEILTGFGFSGNACDTHGPFLSPTGRLYIVQGRHGHEFKDRDGKVYSKGKAGRIYSCLPDGSDVRVHAGGGFDNPVEVDFTEEGECIGTVNILYRDRGDCLMHWVEGGVYPREDQADAVAEFKWTGGLLGPVHNLGHVACSGITRYRGTHLGEAFANRWFFTEFNTHKVRYAELKQTGSTFTADVHEFLHCDDGDFHPTDVLEDADGSLLVLNTGGWFLNGCPTSRVAKPEIYGGVYRVKKVGGAEVADPRGQEIAWRDLSSQDLVPLLGDARPAVVEKGIEEFVRRGLEESLHVLQMNSTHQILDSDRAARVRSQAPLTAQICRNVLWAQSRLLASKGTLETKHGDLNSLTGFLGAVKDRDASVRQAAVVALGWLGSGVVERVFHENGQNGNSFSPALRRQLLDSLAISLQPALSASQNVSDPVAALVTRRSAIDGVRDLVSLDEVGSPFEDHAAAFALIRANDADYLLKMFKSAESPRFQRLAVIALDQINGAPLTREMVLPLLSSEDLRLQRTALEVITRREGWGAATLEVLKGWVAEPKLTVDRANALRGFLTAQLSDSAVQAFVVQTLSKPVTSDEVKVLFWEVLQRSTLPVWPATFNVLLTESLAGSNDEIVLASLRIVTQRSLPGYESSLVAIAGDERRSLAVRCEAVTALGGSQTHLAQPVFDSLVQKLASEQANSDEKAMVGRALGNGALSPEQLKALTSVLDPAGPLVVPGLIKAFARCSEEGLGKSLVAALLATESAVSVSPDELAGILRKYPESVQLAAKPLFMKLGVDPAAQAARLDELSPLLEGGNPAAGRVVFFGRKAACGSCHAVGIEGGRVGPHLTTIGASRSAKDLLEAIVYPSASFVNGYRTTLVVTVDGKVVQGVISAETTETITLKTQDLQEIRLRRDEIEEMREASTSIMPTGLDRQLSAEELRDLLAYLKSRK